jgi:hypothetical protein
LVVETEVPAAVLVVLEDLEVAELVLVLRLEEQELSARAKPVVREEI